MIYTVRDDFGSGKKSPGSNVVQMLIRKQLYNIVLQGISSSACQTKEGDHYILSELEHEGGREDTLSLNQT